MSNSDNKICLGCMRPVEADGAVCPHCGFDPNTYQTNPRCLQLGTQLAGKYVIGKVIGEGGFGITYIGWDLLLELPVAIKEYFPPKIASRDATSGNNTIYMFDNANEKSFEDGMKRCVKEARSMSKLESLPGIVSIRDFFHENQTAYIIMEYVDGITLKAYLQEHGRMPAEDVFRIMKPVIKALEQMHQLGMIHRDISPDNIMIRKDGQVKLIDFGAARAAVAEDDEKSLTVMLKRGFTPEEQYRTKGHQGPWTDVYALCATVYYMLTGAVPPEAMERLLEDEYVPLGKCDIEVEEQVAAAIDKGLCVRAKDRYPSMTELLEAVYGRDNEKVLDIGHTTSGGSQTSGVGETVLAGDSTVLVEDEEYPAIGTDARLAGDSAEHQTQTFGGGKKKIIAAIIAVIVVIGIGGAALFLNGKDSGETVPTAAKTETAGTSGVSPGAIETTPGGSEAALSQEPEVPPSQPVTMINAAGMNVEDAKAQISALDAAAIVEVSEEYSDTKSKGTVVSQDVEEGTAWTPGQDSMQIHLVVSKGEQLISVPDIKGKTKSTAVRKIEKAGLKVSSSEKYSSSVAKGKVISQSKKAGSRVKKGTKIKIVVSKGAKPKPQAPTSSSRSSGSSSSGLSSGTSGSTKKSSSSKKSSKKSTSGFDIVGSGGDYVTVN